VEEVIWVGTAPATVREALDMVRAGLGYLTAADAARLPAAAQAEWLRELEQAGAALTAARAFVLAGFTAGQGYCDDADYSARSWLIHRTHVTPGAAVGYTAWAKRTATHPKVLAALAAGHVSESVGRLICLWTGKLPEKFREESDELLIAAAGAGLGLEELAALFAEMYERARSELPDEDPGQDFADRGVKLATTFGGAGVVHGDLTPECAEVLGRVLDALGAPAGKDDDRTRDQRYHDALAEAMRRLLAAGLVPGRAGQPVKAWVHISLADLLLLDGDSALQAQWTAHVREQWAARRAFASETGSEGGAWLEGTPPRRSHAMRPWRLSLPATSTSTRWRTLSGCASNWTRSGGTVRGMRPGLRWNRRSSAAPSTCCRVPVGWRASCGAESWGRGWAARACRWTSATARRSRRGSATRWCCGTASAGGPAGATSPRRLAKCTTPGTRPTGARPAPPTASCSVPSTTRSRSDRDPPVGLDPGPQSGRDDDGVEQGQDATPVS
jgi:hypothetical protein